MKLTIFPSGKGDCLLLEGAQGGTILIDGGERAIYQRWVAPAMGRLARRQATFDLVCVSHVDSDHIGGVLAMLDDAVDWKVFDYQRANGNRSYPRPERPRPPPVARLWHNGFSRLLDQAPDGFASMAANLTTALALADEPDLKAAAFAQSELALSFREAARLEARVSPSQLGISLNPEAKGELLTNERKVKPVGSLAIRLLGPSQNRITQLREKWDEWLGRNEKAMTRVARDAADDVRRLRETGEADMVIPPLVASAKRLGDIGAVTVPNLASIMFLATEGKRTMLLSGDGHEAPLIDGLKAANLMPPQGALHVDVLKVPHHGSENNISKTLTGAVTADHYIFCGNGSHENPDRRVVRLLAEAALSQDGAKPTFWFSSPVEASAPGPARVHAASVERQLAKIAKSSGGRLRLRYPPLGRPGVINLT
jgi:hypothetical protein